MANDKSKTVDPTATETTNVDYSNWTEEQINFAPYWKPAPGKWFSGTLTDVDLRDPKFIRYQFQSLETIECHRGPGDESNDRHEKVMVHAGEKFSISVYKALENIFSDYLAVPFPVQVRVDVIRKDKTADGKDFWKLGAKVPPDTSKKLAEYRKAKAMKGAAKARPSLEG